MTRQKIILWNEFLFELQLPTLSLRSTTFYETRSSIRQLSTILVAMYQGKTILKQFVEISREWKTLNIVIEISKNLGLEMNFQIVHEVQFLSVCQSLSWLSQIFFHCKAWPWVPKPHGTKKKLHAVHFRICLNVSIPDTIFIVPTYCFYVVPVIELYMCIHHALVRWN